MCQPDIFSFWYVILIYFSVSIWNMSILNTFLCEINFWEFLSMKAKILLIFHDFFSPYFNAKIGQRLIQLIKGNPFTTFWLILVKKYPQKWPKWPNFRSKLPGVPEIKSLGTGNFKKFCPRGFPGYSPGNFPRVQP